jgi:uncharacterized protein (DUF362 family)
MSQLRARVAISQGEDPEAMVRRVLEQVGAAQAVQPGDRVVLKPNYVEPRMPETGVTTDPRVIEAVILWLREIGVRDIRIVEGGDTQAKTDRAFALVGLPEIARRHDVRLLNAFADERVVVKIPEAMSLREVGLARTIAEADCLINLPTLKCHSMAYVTLGIKNLMGAIIPDKVIMHHDIDERLRDLATVVRYQICVIDGLVGSEAHETAGSPVKTDVIIGGTSPVATDAVGAMVMGVDPAQVNHLRLCSRAGLGEYRPEEIEVVGTPVEQVRKQYRKPWGFG